MTTTYLEACVEGCGPVPFELQRLLSTVRLLDERVTELRAVAAQRFEECMAMPSLAERKPSAEQAATVVRLRAELEDAQKVIHQLSAEKLKLATTAAELVSGHVRSVDVSLAVFADELLAQAREAEALAQAAAQRYDVPAPASGLMGGAAAYGAPPQQAVPQLAYGYVPRRTAMEAPEALAPAVPPAPPAAARGTAPVRRRALVPGEQVAANTAESGENWIVTTFRGVSGELFEVTDEEAEPGTANRYFLDPQNVLPLPRSASGRDERAMPVGSAVLGVYPGTTTFYRATVLQAPRRQPSGDFDAYMLQFEDDEVEGGGLGRPVDFRHVVASPR